MVDRRLRADLDEIALWNRALTTDEVHASDADASDADASGDGDPTDDAADAKS